jgi:predicted DNA-binding transcriptional regulator AlpA
MPVNKQLPSTIEGKNILRKAQLLCLLNVSGSTLDRMERDGRIPPAVRLGRRAKGWRAGDILAALDRLSAAPV